MKRCFIFLSALAFSQVVNAGNMYVFKDKNGNVLLSSSVDGKEKKPTNDFKSYEKKIKVDWYKDTNRLDYFDPFDYRKASVSQAKKHLKELKSKPDTNPEWIEQGEKEIARKILRAKPDARIGMRAKKVKYETNWGAPNYVNTTITKNGKREQWVYDYGLLYFTNGKLTAIQY